MIASTTIDYFVRDLVSQFNPVRVILFGSHSDGRATEDSDVDLLVEMPVVRPGLADAARMVATLKPNFMVDLIVRTPEQVNLRIAQGDRFLQQAVKKGKILYETANA